MRVPKKVDFTAVTPEILALAERISGNVIPETLYAEQKVFRGLRDLDGNGVCAGLTNISQVTAKKIVDGKEIPMDGKLYYRGIDVEDIVAGFIREDRFGFEETVYLLLFGELPKKDELRGFETILGGYRSLPPNFTRDTIMKTPSRDMMNGLARGVLTLYYYDGKPDDTTVPNVLRQCLQLIAEFPILAAYGYNTYRYFTHGDSLFIHRPEPKLSTAENLLYLLRPDRSYTALEARVLDLALVLHAEHGGGNNSAFTAHVVSSSGTDTYSAMAAALGSLKGPKHGGANNRVMAMMDDVKANVKNWGDEGELADFLRKILHKEAFDRSGLIYGIGHAIYSLSDPRARVFEGFVQSLSRDKGREEEYALYAAIARLAPQLISAERRMYKGVSANIDFYSGFVYEMLGLPRELFTPIFAISRVAGWSAHILEEIVSGGRIIRPAYKSVAPKKAYVSLTDR
ncbi:MAG: citrate/2-methylcitrate synthase [Oscillospiraceae bacterium]|jgi:citrate synthase|nr:citrate/2-methylcitrate synthase [Oscillospiraceae bacterium]